MPNTFPDTTTMNFRSGLAREKPEGAGQKKATPGGNAVHLRRFGGLMLSICGEGACSRWTA
jgi:hypothetical protein